MNRFPKVVAIGGGLFFLLFGIWAMADPESFYDLATFEPYNQHFLQDIGAFQIGLGAVLILATLRPTLESLTLALLGTGIGGAAHAVSHIIGRDLGGNPSRDIPLFVIVAALLLGAGAWQLRSARGH